MVGCVYLSVCVVPARVSIESNWLSIANLLGIVARVIANTKRVGKVRQRQTKVEIAVVSRRQKWGPVLQLRV